MSSEINRIHSERNITTSESHNPVGSATSPSNAINTTQSETNSAGGGVSGQTSRIDYIKSGINQAVSGIFNAASRINNTKSVSNQPTTSGINNVTSEVNRRLSGISSTRIANDNNEVDDEIIYPPSINNNPASGTNFSTNAINRTSKTNNPTSKYNFNDSNINNTNTYSDINNGPKEFNFGSASGHSPSKTNHAANEARSSKAFGSNIASSEMNQLSYKLNEPSHPSIEFSNKTSKFDNDASVMNRTTNEFSTKLNGLNSGINNPSNKATSGFITAATSLHDASRENRLAKSGVGYKNSIAYDSKNPLNKGTSGVNYLAAFSKIAESDSNHSIKSFTESNFGFSLATLKELHNVTESYIQQNKYEEAVRILDAIICQSNEESLNVLNYIKKAQCLLLMKKDEEALDVVEKITLILQSNKNLENLRKFSSVVIAGLEQLIEEYVERKCFNVSLRLAENQSEVIKYYCMDDRERLHCYKETAGLLEKIIRETIKKSLKTSYDKPRILMEKLIREMLLLKEVSVEEKAINVAWAYKYFGFYCDEIGNYHRAVELNKQGITAMKTVFGAEALKFKIFGHLYNNMAATLLRLKLRSRAVSAYQKAIDCYNEAGDWKNQKTKYEIINQTLKCLEILKSKK